MYGTILPRTLPILQLGKNYCCMPKNIQKRRANGDGWIFQDGESWRYKLAVGIDPLTGKVLYRGGRSKTHSEATEKLRKLQSENLNGLLSTRVKGNLSTYLEEWVQNKIKPNRANATFRQYQWLIETHIIPHIGKKKVEELRRVDVQKLIALKANQNSLPRSKSGKTIERSVLSRNTLRLIRAVLHSAYNDAIIDGLVSMNPASHVELPKEPPKPPVSLKEEEARKLLQEANNSSLPEFWRFLFLTGTRLSEATGLRWSDLDLEQGTAIIRGQLLRVNGKLVYTPGTKTNQNRTLQLPDVLVQTLRDLRTKYLISDTKDTDGIVFLNPYGRRLDAKYVRNQLRTLCVSAGVPVISPHKARHTAATLALGATGDLHAVQKMLGHAQISLTANLYGHGTSEAQKRVACALSTLMVPRAGNISE